MTTLQHLRKRLEPPLRRIFHLYWWMVRGMTLGVRGVVLDGDGRVFLVRHSYVAGWHLPGGGVEPGETVLAGHARELLEEGNIELTGPPVLHGVYFNRRASRRDHVALFVVRDFRQQTAPVPDHEIVAHGFFALDSMPGDTTAGTRARLAEVLGGAPKSDDW